MTHGTLYAYRQHGCRCDVCVATARARRKVQPSNQREGRRERERRYKAKRRAERVLHDDPTTHRRPDDGIIDTVAADRLLDGTLSWWQATLPEAREAARRGFARGLGWDVIETVTRLRPADIVAARDAAARRVAA